MLIGMMRRGKIYFNEYLENIKNGDINTFLNIDKLFKEYNYDIDINDKNLIDENLKYYININIKQDYKDYIILTIKGGYLEAYHEIVKNIIWKMIKDIEGIIFDNYIDGNFKDGIKIKIIPAYLNEYPFVLEIIERIIIFYAIICTFLYHYGEKIIIEHIRNFDIFEGGENE